MREIAENNAKLLELKPGESGFVKLPNKSGNGFGGWLYIRITPWGMVRYTIGDTKEGCIKEMDQMFKYQYSGVRVRKLKPHPTRQPSPKGQVQIAISPA